MIELHDVCASYLEEQVLAGVSLVCKPGEIVALVGNNGCGKSTLGRVVCGALLPTSGQVLVDGVDPSAGADERMQVRRLVGFVQQDPLDQLVSSVVYDEVAFGPRNIGCDEVEVSRRVSAALEAVGLAGCAERSTTELSGGEQQRIAVAGVLAMDPHYIVFDESTSQLDPAARSRMRALYVALARERGIGVVLITHDAHEIELADNVVHLDCAVGPAPSVKDRLYAVRSDAPCDHYAAALAMTGAALEIADVDFSYGERQVLCGASLRVEAGEVVLLRGASGAGKSTFASIAAGLVSPDAGSVTVGGAPATPMRVGLALQNPEAQFFLDTVRDELAFAPRNAGCDECEVEARVRCACAMVGLHEGLLERYPFELSGGQARRVALGSILTTDAGAYILDEPTSALDAPGREACHRFVRELANAGAAVLVISHDVEEWSPFVDGVAVLEGGSVRRLEHGAAARTACPSIEDEAQSALQRPYTAAEEIASGLERHCAKPAPQNASERLASVDARVKIAVLMAMTAAVLCAHTLPAIGLWVVVLAALVRAAGLTLAGVARSMRPVLLILAFTLLANLLSCDGAGDIALAGPVGLSVAGGMRGLMAVLRIAVLVALSLVMVATTRANEVGDACVRLMRPLGRMGVPVAQVGAAIEVALRFMPIVRDELGRIRLAQRARGVRFDDGPLFDRVRAWASVFTPLIVGLFRRADRLGEAMAARCFGSGGGRMPAPQPLGPIDRRVLAIGLGLSAILMAAGLIW